MAGTFLAGPSVVAGTMFSLPGTPPGLDYNPVAGPSVTYQGDSLPDIRYFLQKDQQKVGVIPAHFNSPYFLLTDTVPSASAATPVNVAAAANVTNGTPMTLVTTASSGISPGTILIPQSSAGVGPGLPSAASVSVIGLDLGFATCTTATTGVLSSVNRTGTSTSAIPLLSLGQWVFLPNVGNAAGTTGLFTKVIAVGATTVTVSPAPAAATTSVPIASCNLYDPNIQAMQPSLQPTSVWPYFAGGLGAFLNPLETCARCLGINAVGGAAGGAFIVAGYDVYGSPMTEKITASAGSTVYGKKAFKYVLSVTPQFTDAHNYSAGTGDTFGFATRSDFWEYTNLFYNGTFVTTSTGWLAADLTSPATNVTGDSRGTLQVSSRGNGTQISGGAATDGVKRIAMFMSLPLYNVLAGTPNNSVPMYGVTPA